MYAVDLGKCRILLNSDKTESTNDFLYSNS